MMLKALYGMLIASLLYYKRFVSDIRKIGFELNPYDPCVANRSVEGTQHTLTWHVDDIKSSHVLKRVNDEFKSWLEETYGEDGIGEVKVTRGNRHDYLAMMLDFSKSGKLMVDQIQYILDMCEEFPEPLKEVKCPWTEKLFDVDFRSPKLDESKGKIFHTFVMKLMFVSKRARQDISPGVSFLSTRTSKSTEQDWKKLTRLMSFMKTTAKDVLTLEADDEMIGRWHIDAAFAVHCDFKSHTGGTFTLGKGCITSGSLKQKVNSRSTTQAELIASDDLIDKVVWIQLFIQAQGFNCKALVDRDNTSTLKLEMNGKVSSGKRTRHFNIKYFYITDLIERKVISVQYCPTEEMVGDYMSKPLVGFKFHYFRAWIMNLPEFPELASRSVLANKNQPRKKLNTIKVTEDNDVENSTEWVLVNRGKFNKNRNHVNPNPTKKSFRNGTKIRKSCMKDLIPGIRKRGEFLKQ